MTFASTQAGLAPRLIYYVRGDSAMGQDTFTTTIQLVPDYDTHVRDPEPVVDSGPGIQVGGAPSARAMVFLALPSYILDSVTIIRAQLELRLTQPAAGRPREEFLVRAVPVLSAAMAYGQYRLQAAEELAHVGDRAALQALEDIRAAPGASADEKARATIAEDSSPAVEEKIDDLIFDLNLKFDCLITPSYFSSAEIESGPLSESAVYKKALAEGISF